MEILVLPALYGDKKALLAPLRGGEALSAIRVPNRHGLKAAQHTAATSSTEQLGTLVQSALRGTSRGRRRPADRDCASEPLCRPTDALLPLSSRRSSTPPAGRHNAMPQGTAVLTDQTKPSVPD